MRARTAIDHTGTCRGRETERLRSGGCLVEPVSRDRWTIATARDRRARDPPSGRLDAAETTLPQDLPNGILIDAAAVSTVQE